MKADRKIKTKRINKLGYDRRKVKKLEPPPTKHKSAQQRVIKSKRIEEELRKLSRAVEQSPASIVITDTTGAIEYVNSKFIQITGYSLEEVKGKNPRVLKSGETPAEEYTQLWSTITSGGEWRGEFHNKKKNGDLYWEFAVISPITNTHGNVTHFLAVKEDITERKLAEVYGELGREILQILNEPAEIQDSIQRVLAALKTRTGFDAVGIRLQDGEDFPYFAQKGFSTDFLQTENTLIERGADGGVCRDENCNVNLECTCGLVISGKTDPANSLFTRGGSCWTNNSFTLLDIPPDEEPRYHPRNKCIHKGYASVALVPIRNKEKIVGLIQLNDRRKGRFTLETVTLLEGISSHIGSALMRKQAEEALKKAAIEREKLIQELQYALDNIKTLQGLIPICSNCKKIRDDQGFWNQVEGYISQHTDAKFTHGICPDCARELYGDLYEQTINKPK